MNRKSRDSGSQKYCQEWCEVLLKKHGDKILKDPSNEWTGEEIVDHYLYKLFSCGLSRGLSYKIVLDERNNIIKKYGSKIYNNPTSEWTQGEIAAHNLYKVYSDLLHEGVPDAKALDTALEFFHRNEIDSVRGLFRYFFKYAKKLFWIVFLIAVFLAVVKYLLQ